MNMKFKIFLINLDSSKDRLDLCQQNFGKFGVEFERVPAVNGKALSEAEIEQVYDRARNLKEYKKDLNRGELGCYLSHIKCWQKIVDEKLDFALILEDDAKISSSFDEFEQLFPLLKNWDYVRLAFASRNVPIANKVSLSKEHDLVYYKKVPINMLAQAISYEGAKKLLSNSQKISRPVDVDIKHYWEKGIHVVGIDPPLVKARHDIDSEIDKVSGNVGRKGNTSFIRNVNYVFKHKVKSKFYDLFKPKLSSYIKL